MEQAQLLRGCRPDLSQQAGVDGRAVGDDLCRIDPGLAQSTQEAVHHALVDGALHQLEAHQAIAIGTGRVHRQEQGELALIDLVDAQHAREGLDDPGR
jgi:hypothetical protein